MKHTCLPHERLDKLPDCHTRWNRMRVDNNIGPDSVLCEGHIFLRNNQPDCPFLSTTRAEFVANGGESFFADTHLTDTESLLAFRHECLIYESELSLLWHGRHIAHLTAVILNTHRPHSNDDLLVIHLGILSNKAIVIEVAVIIPGFDANRAFFLNIRESGIALCAADTTAFLACFVHVVIRDTKHPALDTGLIEENGVFDIVSIKRHNRDDGIESAWVLFVVDEVEVATLHDGYFAIIDDDAHFINTHLVVAVINRRGLFCLTASEHITRHWIIFGEADLVSHDTHKERWMDFDMRVLFTVTGEDACAVAAAVAVTAPVTALSRTFTPAPATAFFRARRLRLRLRLRARTAFAFVITALALATAVRRTVSRRRMFPLFASNGIHRDRSLELMTHGYQCGLRLRRINVFDNGLRRLQAPKILDGIHPRNILAHFLLRRQRRRILCATIQFINRIIITVGWIECRVRFRSKSRRHLLP